MTRRSLALFVLWMACTSPEAPVQPEAPGNPAGAATAEGRAESPWHWRSDTAAAATPVYLLGVMGQSGIQHCPGGGYDPEWLAVRPTIGRVSVSGPADAVLDPLMDQPVLALGLPGEPPPAGSAPPTALEMCPPAQMRSDWQQTPRGMLIERNAAPTLRHLQLDAVRPLHELRAQADGDHVIVTLTNPVPVALADVELRVHYEGCFGKPGTHAQATPVGVLGVGAQASARVLMLSSSRGEPEGRGEFRAYSIQLVGRGESVVIDLDVRLDRLGVAIACPNE